MKRKTWLNLWLALGLMLALGTGIAFVSEGARAQGSSPHGTLLGTAFTYQGRLTDTGTGEPIAGPCDLRFTLYESLTGNDPVSGATPQTKSVTPDDGYLSVDLDFGTSAFSGGGRFLKIEVDCGGGYTTLSPRVELTPAPYAFHAVSTGALHGYEVSDNAPSPGDVLAWDGNSWMPTTGGGGGWSLTGNSGTTPGTNFVGTSDDKALELHVNGAGALRLEPHATSPNVIGGYSGNSVTAGVHGATIGGGGASGSVNQVTANYATVGGGYGNTASAIYAAVGGGESNAASHRYATVGGGWDNTAGRQYATVGGGYENTASNLGGTVGGGVNNTASSLGGTVGGGLENTAGGHAATVPGGYEAQASLHGQMAYASGRFASAGDAQASLYVMRGVTANSGTWNDLYLDGSSVPLTMTDGRTLTFDILVVGRSDAGESAGYYCWGVVENVGGTTAVLGGGGPCILLGEDDAAWDVQVVADDGNDTLAVQVQGNGETIRWVATVRTAEVAW